MAELYPRPDRERIAERLRAAERAAAGTAAIAAGIAAQAPPEPGHAPPEPDLLALFGANARRIMRRDGLANTDLMTRTGATSASISRALGGIACGLRLAGRIAAALGTPIAEMLAPHACDTCHGAPPAPWICPACGLQGEAGD